MRNEREPKDANYRGTAPTAHAVLLFVFMAATAGFAGGSSAHPKLAPDLSVKNPAALVNVIVQFRTAPQPAEYSLLLTHGTKVAFNLPIINALAMPLNTSAIAALEQDPNVVYISPDRPVQSAATNESYQSAVMADVAAQQYGLDGTGVGVTIIDSGISDHKDFHNGGPSRVVYSQSFVSGDSSTADAYGHGTYVAGLVAGNGSASGKGSGYASPIKGMAPNANIINLRVLDKNGAGTDSQVIAAVQNAITLKSKYNIQVINLSLGRQVFESYSLDPLCQAVEKAWQAGIVVVVAAGNDGRDNSHGTYGYATIGAPANDPAVITVGATRTMGTPSRLDDAIASYSSKGPTLLDHIAKPDLVAPGNRIDSLLVKGSTLDVSYPSLEVAPTIGHGPAQYFRLSGTSVATPLVSGAAALMLQKSSTLTPDAVKARLMKTAWKGFGIYSTAYDVHGNRYNDQYDLFTYGAGYLDVDAVLGNTDVASGSTLSPTAVYNSSTGAVTLVNTSGVPWARSVIWNSSTSWADVVIWGNTISAGSVIWGNSVVWGNTTDAGFSVIWGTSVIWGNSTAPLSVGEDGEN